jgi:hypothetical protein
MANIDCSKDGNDQNLCKIGNNIAKKMGYEYLTELEAIYRYLIDKYNWLPSQVRELTNEDLLLLLDGYDNVEIMP